MKKVLTKVILLSALFTQNSYAGATQMDILDLFMKGAMECQFVKAKKDFYQCKRRDSSVICFNYTPNKNPLKISKLNDKNLFDSLICLNAFEYLAFESKIE